MTSSPLVPDDDWRRQGQERYLCGLTFIRSTSEAGRPSGADHDDCEFCFVKFVTTSGHDSDEQVLTDGYCTTDGERWICSDCFADFRDEFELGVLEQAL